MASIPRIARIDYGASTAVLLFALSWIIYFAAGTADDPPAVRLRVLLGQGALTAASLILLAWRTWLIRSTFADGMEMPGTITAVDFFRGRGRIEYMYPFAGGRYTSSNFVRQTRETRRFQEGMPVAVMVDRNNPKRAFIRELYEGRQTTYGS